MRRTRLRSLDEEDPDAQARQRTSRPVHRFLLDAETGSDQYQQRHRPLRLPEPPFMTEGMRAQAMDAQLWPRRIAAIERRAAAIERRANSGRPTFFAPPPVAPPPPPPAQLIDAGPFDRPRAPRRRPIRRMPRPPMFPEIIDVPAEALPIWPAGHAPTLEEVRTRSAIRARNLVRELMAHPERKQLLQGEGRPTLDHYMWAMSHPEAIEEKFRFDRQEILSRRRAWLQDHPGAATPYERQQMLERTRRRVRARNQKARFDAEEQLRREAEMKAEAADRRKKRQIRAVEMANQYRLAHNIPELPPNMPIHAVHGDQHDESDQEEKDEIEEIKAEFEHPFYEPFGANRISFPSDDEDDEVKEVKAEAAQLTNPTSSTSSALEQILPTNTQTGPPHVPFDPTRDAQLETILTQRNLPQDIIDHRAEATELAASIREQIPSEVASAQPNQIPAAEQLPGPPLEEKQVSLQSELRSGLDQPFVLIPWAPGTRWPYISHGRHLLDQYPRKGALHMVLSDYPREEQRHDRRHADNLRYHLNASRRLRKMIFRGY